MSALSRPEFHDEKAAFAHLEKVVWAGQPVCPHCGGVDRITKVKANPEKRIRLGLWRCGQCKGQFTVKVGTVFEHARMPLHKMLQAVYLMSSSKKGVSAHQLHRTLEVTYKTAWFLAHRIREAMRSGDLVPFGQGGGGVEVDETYIGRVKGAEVKRGGYYHKQKVLSLVDRASGKARSYVITDFNMKTVAPILDANMIREARLLTDEAPLYRYVGWNFAEHAPVTHKRGEYVSRQGSHDPHKHNRRLLQHLQAWDARRLSALRREAPAPLPRRVRFPLLEPRRLWDRRSKPCADRVAGCCWQAPHLPQA